MSPDLDPLTGKDPSSLTVAQLAERLAMERALREQALASLRELMDERADAVDKALQTQAIEYVRRLDALNGEAGRLANILAQSVPREVFDNYKETQAAAARVIANTLSEERGARDGFQRLIALVLFLIALATIILKVIPLGP